MRPLLKEGMNILKFCQVILLNIPSPPQHTRMRTYVCANTSLPASGSYKVILMSHKISLVEIDGQVARVTEWVWLTIFMCSVEQIVCQVRDKLGT